MLNPIDSMGAAMPGGPSGGLPAGGSPLGAQAPDIHGMLDSRLASTKAKYDKLMQSRSMLDKVRRELGELTKLGDTVSQEDVVKAAGVLVGHGLGADAVAGLLADMPTNGPGIATWVAQHAQDITQREAQLMPVLQSMRHQMGVQGLQSLAGDHVRDVMGQGQMPGGAASTSGLAPGPATVPGEASMDSTSTSNPLGASDAD